MRGMKGKKRKERNKMREYIIKQLKKKRGKEQTDEEINFRKEAK